MVQKVLVILIRCMMIGIPFNNILTDILFV